MLSLSILVACLVQHGAGTPLLSRRADRPQAPPVAASEAVGFTRLADLCIVISAGVLGCVLLGIAAYSYFCHREHSKASKPAEPVLIIEGFLTPCAPASRQRTPSKLFDDLIRAAYAAHEAACGPAGADPSLRRKSVASGIMYNGVSPADAPAQRRQSAMVISS